MQLRQFDLELALSCAGVPGENVEDKLGAIDHAPLDNFFDIALLRRAEIVIEKEDVGIYRSGGASDFFELARTDQRGRIRPVPSLENLSDNFRASASRQRAQLGERFVCIELGDQWLVTVSLCASRGLRRSRSRCRLARGLRLSCDCTFSTS